MIAGLQFELRHDPLREVLVVQEILAETFRRLHAQLGEGALDGRELHRRTREFFNHGWHG